MLLKIFVFCCLVASSFAWLAPERCEESKQKRSVSLETYPAATVPNIEDIAKRQHDNLLETYKEHEFLGVPIRGNATEGGVCPPQGVEIHAPFNCTFHTYRPRLLSSVACLNAGCKLSHTVATTDTYTASEGYNWGTKITSKFSLFDKIFEVGGEVSSGGTYTCTYNKGKTTTDLVECSDSSGESGDLLLYNVKSDIRCNFGGIVLEKDFRMDNGNPLAHFYFEKPEEHFTPQEIEEFQASKQIVIEPCSSFFIMDMSLISDRLLQKLMDKAPLYNPYTDVLLVHPSFMAIFYFRKSSEIPEYRRIIPFTNEGGDSVYQYACVKKPF